MTFVLLLSSFVSAAVVDDAISWMHDNSLTIYDNKTDFNADRWLRRDEAAKFYVNFAKLLSKTTYVKTANQCIFSDINDSWSDLKDIVVESCRLGLFQWSKWEFDPTSQLTNAQAITVLVRLLAGNQSEVWQTHRANNYYTKANELGILESVVMNTKDSIATRGNVGVIIYDGKDTNISTNTTSTNKIVFENQWVDTINSICKRYTNEWLPNSTRVADAKFINSKLQDVRDNWQHLVSTYINESNVKLNQAWITDIDRCRYSRLIDALQKQQWYIRSYTIENWITTIGIDFLTYQDDISKIQRDWLWLSNMKNTSTKVRYYKLSSNPELQTLNLDNRWYVLWYKYINNFNTWLNEHCNDTPIYNWEKRYEEKYENWVRIREGYTEEINRKESNWIDHFCVENRLNEQGQYWDVINFKFNSYWDLQKIDLNRRHLSTAW